MSEEGFFSRWARRKSEVRGGRTPEEAPAPAARQPAAAPAEPPAPPQSARAAPPAAAGAAVAPAQAAPAAPAEAEPLPSMEDVARLARDSDYSAFMRRGVDEDVKRAAMKKLFTDPHYNVMDGLDIYIDDYSKPDPIPMAMLRKMTQSKMLGLFRDEEQDAKGTENAAAVAQATPAAVPTDDRTAPDVAQSRADGTEVPAGEGDAGTAAGTGAVVRIAAAGETAAPDAAPPPAGNNARPETGPPADAGSARPASSSEAS